jgi:uncharacterized protein YqgV (UPF0045/DUF77 family)
MIGSSLQNVKAWVTVRAMARLRAEFTVEPFADGAPGPHVLAAIEAARVAGLEPDVGPFGTAVHGEAAAVNESVRAALAAAFANGAERVTVTVERA